MQDSTLNDVAHQREGVCCLSSVFPCGPIVNVYIAVAFIDTPMIEIKKREAVARECRGRGIQLSNRFEVVFVSFRYDLLAGF